MQLFHRCEGPTYIRAIAAILVLCFIANIAATKEGVGVWGSENKLVIWMIAATIAPLFVQTRWLQLASPIILLALSIAFMVIFYPVIT